jgi:phospholipid transport system substrate-binding protein
MIGGRARAFLAVLCVLPWLATGVDAALAKDGAEGPVEFVTTLGDRTIRMLSNASLSEGEREARFRYMLDEGFDLDAIARFALGRYWRRATRDERAEYRVLFEEFIVRTYVGRLGRYGGEQLSVVGTIADGDGDTLVRSEILDPNFPPVRVDWRIRRIDNSYRIVDVVLEGVSMALTQRDEFAAVIQKNGGTVEGLLNELRSKNTGQ